MKYNRIKAIAAASAALCTLAGAQSLSAQSAIDAYTLSSNDLRGTARFMSMGGAFTALGGDLSTLTQNPGGIGIYRYSEIGATLDIDLRSYKTSTPGYTLKDSQTKAFCNNFGYVGTVRLDGPMRTFNWGVSYGRLKSFDHITKGYNIPTNTSLSNYVAAYSQNIDPADMEFTDSYNPYFDSRLDWLSILSYSAYMINPVNGGNYVGLFQNGTTGDAEYVARDHGYIDQYSFNFGGNIQDMVYWGIGVGVTDLDYRRDVYYSESMENALVPTKDGALVTGNAGFDLYNRKHITGTGWDLKLGLIFKPVNELRIGLAFHTPTWYNVTTTYDAEVDYSYFNPADDQVEGNPLSGNEYTEVGAYDWKMRTPWRVLTGIAGVIGSDAILSFDYEYQAYDKMHVDEQTGYNEFSAMDAVNQDVRDYFKGSHIFRFGAEYRVTPQFSLRAGYNFKSTNVKSEAADGNIQVFTAGTDPSYRFAKNSQGVSCGLGYHSGGWYVDAAYVYKLEKSTFHGYTDFDGLKAPTAKVSDHYSSIVISAGYKF